MPCMLSTLHYEMSTEKAGLEKAFRKLRWETFVQVSKLVVVLHYRPLAK